MIRKPSAAHCVAATLAIVLAVLSVSAVPTKHSQSTHARPLDSALRTSGPVANAQTSETYLKLADEAEQMLRKDVIGVWFPRTVDNEHGGFYANFTRDWKPAPSEGKFSVFQGRMTWIAAQLCLRRPDLKAQFLPVVKHGVDYLNDVLWDKQYGGFYWGLADNGQIDPSYSDGKHLYGMSFGVYGAAAAYQASGDARALELAKKAFKWMDTHAHDAKNGGYFEWLTRDGRVLQADPSKVKADAVPLALFPVGYKSMNSHIHLLEAFAQLYEVWKDETLRQRLVELLTITRDKICMEPGVMNLYFSIDWRPIPDHDSYGHDIETAYLMLEAEDVLGRGHDARTERMAKLLVDHGLAFGWDETYGGFYRDGTTFGAAEDRAKEWWVQVEGLNALLLMHERYGKQTDVYFKAFLQQWQFLKEHQLDAQEGGLYDTVERNGTPTNFVKARIWKAAYHDGRALLNVTERLRRLAQAKPVANFIPADNENIQYTGRIDFSDAKQPKFWASGTYLQATFKGTYCDVVVADEQLYGTSHNYIDIVVDASAPQRVRTSGPVTTIRAAEGLTDGPHTITVTKDTESGIGYVQFLGFNCDALLTPPKRPVRKLEFIGDSITCGSSIDVSQVACDKGAWYDQHNAYLSYGPVTARALNAEWQVTAVSGIGLIHSCCGMTVTMPQVFDKLNARANQAAWDFSLYQPDAVTVCLGQNDGIQDNATFQQRYIDFIADIRRHYPKAKIVCLTSPMADGRLDAFLQQNLTEIVARIKRAGDQNVSSFFVTAQLNDGCGRHPSLAQHQLVAREVSGYLRTLLKW